jgi:hypothetical protein
MRHSVPLSVPPYDSTNIGPNQLIIASFTSAGQADPVWLTIFRLETSYCARTSGGNASSRCRCVGTITDEVTSCCSISRKIVSASNLPTMITGCPANRCRTDVSGALCCSGPTTRWGPGGNADSAVIAST